MMRTVAGRLSGFAVLHAFVAVMLMGAPAHGQGTLEPHPDPLAQALALLEPLRAG